MSNDRYKTEKQKELERKMDEALKTLIPDKRASFLSQVYNTSREPVTAELSDN